MNRGRRGIRSRQPVSCESFDESIFGDLVAKRAALLLEALAYLQYRAGESGLTRPLLGDLLFQSRQLEELLDEYGARHNQRWWRFRALIATIKLFACVSYTLLHIRHVLPSYRLLPIERDFVGATEHALLSAGGVVEEAARQLMQEVERLEIPRPSARFWPLHYSEQLPVGHLPHDRGARHMDSARTIVVRLTTEFLNLAAESESLHTAAKCPSAEYDAYCPEHVSEENLRRLQHRFHNLQSLYDTHVSETQVEHRDADLPVLRGHISVLFHLLEVATELAHYVERHVPSPRSHSAGWGQPVVEVDAPLATLMGYVFTYASLYLVCGQRLCQAILKRYAEIGRVEVAVPNYRGFHVRPATLVAKIVMHYGSDVRMELDGQSYDASSPLELFRANEKINASKRRWLAREIAQLPLRQKANTEELLRRSILEVILTLAEQRKLVIYEQPLSLSSPLDLREGGLLEGVSAEIMRLQATGQIDISTGVTIAFVGDKRVLADLELLAKQGYGEDSFGNNVSLPRALSYLRR